MNIIKIEGKSCKNKLELFQEFKIKLDFPDYFSPNWDSFEEVLYDFAKENDFLQLLIFDFDKLLDEDENDRKIFSDILYNLEQETGYQCYRVEKI